MTATIDLTALADELETLRQQLPSLSWEARNGSENAAALLPGVLARIAALEQQQLFDHLADAEEQRRADDQLITAAALARVAQEKKYLKADRRLTAALEDVQRDTYALASSIRTARAIGDDVGSMELQLGLRRRDRRRQLGLFLNSTLHGLLPDPWYPRPGEEALLVAAEPMSSGATA